MNVTTTIAANLDHVVFIRNVYGFASRQVLPARCTLNSPSLLTTRFRSPVYVCVRPGSKLAGAASVIGNDDSSMLVSCSLSRDRVTIRTIYTLRNRSVFGYFLNSIHASRPKPAEIMTRTPIDHQTSLISTWSIASAANPILNVRYHQPIHGVRRRCMSQE
jgi:hypothetical protein